jgi:DNA-binding CsgD family transcriptional regulator
MIADNEYKLFLEFVDKYMPVNYEGIDKSDPLVRELNSIMKKNNQFFYIADMIKLNVPFVCDTIEQVLGIAPGEFDPRVLHDIIHPTEKQRHTLSRSKMIRITMELFDTDQETFLMSTNLHCRHADGHYVNLLVQAYTFSTLIPINTVYSLFIHTDINWFGKLKYGFNHYVGNDMSYFRKPDKDLILTGCIFTDREFEILKLIRDGLDSHAIGDKLFLSTHTVDTHRRNILKKTGMANTAELIFDLQEKGVL